MLLPCIHVVWVRGGAVGGEVSITAGVQAARASVQTSRSPQGENDGWALLAPDQGAMALPPWPHRTLLTENGNCDLDW